MKIDWIQNFGYTDDGYRCERWGGAAVGFYFALSTAEENYKVVKGPFASAERRNNEIIIAIENNGKKTNKNTG